MLWDIDNLQFIRLLGEINAAGLGRETEDTICESMDLENAELQTLLIRADNVWENEIKPYASLFCLNGPLTPVAIAGQMLEHECVEGVVSVDLDELINHNHEGLMDLLSERLIGSQLLQDIQYKVLVNDGDQILIVVSGIVDSDTLELLGDNDNDDESELPA